MPATPTPGLQQHPLGDTAGTKALIEVLLAHRSVPADALLAAIARLA
jgi:hypothetical protein